MAPALIASLSVCRSRSFLSRTTFVLMACLRNGRDSQLYCLRGPGSSEEIIKKSRFVAQVTPVSTVDEADAFISGCRDPRASHTCWAYTLPHATRCSDDGEPAGTAGRPMLASLTSENLVNVAVAVTRYYGGINLGTGGLARAYGGAVCACIKSVGKIPITPSARVQVTVSCDQTGAIYSIFNNVATNVTKVSEEFTTDGQVIYQIQLSKAELVPIKEQIMHSTKGAALIVDAD